MARVQLIKGGGDSFDLAAALEQAARASGKDENPERSAFFMAFLEEGASVAAAVYVAKQLAEQSDFPHLGGEGDTKTFGDRVYSPLGYNLG